MIERTATSTQLGAARKQRLIQHVHKANHHTQPLSLNNIPASQLRSTLRLLRKTKARSRARVLKHHVATLEKNVAKDGKPEIGICLDATKACARACVRRSEVDQLAGHSLNDSANDDGEVGWCGAAREDVAAGLLVELGAGERAVVGVGDGLVDVDEGGARVHDTVDGRLGGCSGLGSDCVACCLEAPEAPTGVGSDVGDRASVFAGVDETEVVAAWCAVFEGDCKQRSSQRRLDCVEEGFLLSGSDLIK